MKIINLTPHDVNIYNDKLELVETVKRSMKVARLDNDKSEMKWKPFISDIQFFQTKYGIPYLAKIDEQGNELNRTNFPRCQGGIIYIVSALFRSSFDRADLWQPGELIRDDEGRPIGCIGLSQ
jgi:hypothetical protein